MRCDACCRRWLTAAPTHTPRAWRYRSRQQALGRLRCWTPRCPARLTSRPYTSSAMARLPPSPSRSTPCCLTNKAPGVVTVVSCDQAPPPPPPRRCREWHCGRRTGRDDRQGVPVVLRRAGHGERALISQLEEIPGVIPYRRNFPRTFSRDVIKFLASENYNVM